MLGFCCRGVLDEKYCVFVREVYWMKILDSFWEVVMDKKKSVFRQPLSG